MRGQSSGERYGDVLGAIRFSHDSADLILIDDSREGHDGVDNVVVALVQCPFGSGGGAAGHRDDLQFFGLNEFGISLPGTFRITAGSLLSSESVYRASTASNFGIWIG